MAQRRTTGMSQVATVEGSQRRATLRARTLPCAERVPDRLLRVDEAAQLLSVRPATMYQWAYQRRIPVVKLFGPRGALRFRESDLRALIARSVRPVRREQGGGGLDL
jgi:excisionase family DNA binding protein